MKSLFSRLRGRDKEGSTPTADRPASSQTTGNTRASYQDAPGPSVAPASPLHSPVHLSLPLPDQPIRRLSSSSTATTTSTTTSSIRPASTALGLGSAVFDTIALRAFVQDGDGAGMGGTGMDGPGLETDAHETAGKKVTFKSPAPTPTPSALMHDVNISPNHLQPGSSTPGAGPSRPRLPSRQSVPTSSPHEHQLQPPPTVRKHSLPPLTSIHPPRSSSASIRSHSPTKSAYARTSISQTTMASPSSFASPTPSAHSTAAQSYLVLPNSWSEMAEEELIQNLGPRERTRQEVLWEIVSSEERYVQDLIKLNDTFCRALLPPSVTSPVLSLDDPLLALSRTLSPASLNSPASPDIGSDSPNLPIAARYARSPSSAPGHGQVASDESGTTESSATPSGSGPSARQDAYNRLTNGRPGGLGPPVSAQSPKVKQSLSSVRDKALSHRSLPPAISAHRGISESRSTDVATGKKKNWSGSFARLSHPSSSASASASARRAGSRVNSGSSLSSILHSSQVHLPEELEKVLRVLSGGILQGHLKLAAALRKRYEDQYPLVRSLADVFTAHSSILREYATYILHLEAALHLIDSALSSASRPAPTSRRNSRQSPSDLAAQTTEHRLGLTLLNLEEIAMDRGEAGLSIALSKPFQRLLKYPLLFQNLLFNTDASLREYEATLAMVDEVERIVRGIEDEKVDKEERERTRDAWARIDGLEGDKGLMAPKASRVLVSETQLSNQDTSAMDVGAAGKTKRSKNRLSDILKKPEPAELWIIRFSDVSLICAKTGETQLPISSTRSKRESMPEMGGRGKYATVGRRSQLARVRNLYKFIKVHEWYLQPKTGSTDALLSMNEISRLRSSPIKAAVSPSKRVSSAPSKSAQSPPTASPIAKRDTSIPPTDRHTAGPAQTPSRIPVKTQDGPSSARIAAIRSGTVRSTASGGDTDTIISDRLSVMSFAFNNGDQVRPTRIRPKVPPSPAGPRTPVRSGNSPASTAVRVGGHLQGKAADAKFAHRLRSTEVPLIDAEDQPTVRPSSAARRSLPPAMMRSTFGSGITAGTGGGTSTSGPRQAVPLSPKTGLNGTSVRGPEGQSGKGSSGAVSTKVDPIRPGSVSSRRTQPRPGVSGVTPIKGDAAGIAKEGGGAASMLRTPHAGARRGGMI